MSCFTLIFSDFTCSHFGNSPLPADCDCYAVTDSLKQQNLKFEIEEVLVLRAVSGEIRTVSYSTSIRHRICYQRKHCQHIKIQDIMLRGKTKLNNLQSRSHHSLLCITSLNLCNVALSRKLEQFTRGVSAGVRPNWMEFLVNLTKRPWR